MFHKNVIKKQVLVRLIEKNRGGIYAIDNNKNKVILSDSWKEEFRGLFAIANITNDVPGIQFGYIRNENVEYRYVKYSGVVAKNVVSFVERNYVYMKEIPNWEELSDFEIENLIKGDADEVRLEVMYESEEKWSENEAMAVEDIKEQHDRDERTQVARRDELERGILYCGSYKSGFCWTSVWRVDPKRWTEERFVKEYKLNYNVRWGIEDWCITNNIKEEEKKEPTWVRVTYNPSTH